MALNLDRRRKFIQGVRTVLENCVESKTQAEKESWLGDAVRVMVKYEQEDYPDILSGDSCPSEMENLNGSVNLFIVAMRDSYYPRALAHLQGVNRILNLTNPAFEQSLS